MRVYAGSAKSAKPQRRVARLEKIMDDMFRHKKLNADGRSGSHTAQGDRVIQEVTIQSKSGRLSHKASPRHSPKPSSAFSTPRVSPRPSAESPKPGQNDAPQKFAEK